jgi:nicotinamidase-related amidase
LAKNLVDLYESDSAARYYGENDRSDNFYKISPEKGEAIFEKNTYSAFSGTQGQLEKYLKKIKIKKIYVSGIYTTGCVEATLVEAFARGFHVQVVEDCVETFDNEHPQKLQSLLLENWRYLYGKHTNSKQIKA